MTTRRWPLVVRRAQPADEQAVLGFATRTWHDWDYIPHAFPRWLEETDGVMLVGTVGDPSRDGPPSDAHGAALEVGQVIAVVRVATPASGEAWLEGIRVDPRVRGMDVATDLQVAELEWAAAQGAHVVRYATSARNEGSLRLGTRGGFEPLVAFQSHWWSPTGEDDDEELPSGFLPDVQAAATRRRKWLLGELAKAGLVATGEADELWQRAAGDASFIAAEHLYEPRAWAMQELTPAAFAGHHERGEVLLLERDDGWAVAIIAAEQGPAEDAGLRFALLCGNGAVALALLEATRQLADEPVFFRAAANAPLVADHESAFRAANYVFREWTLQILARQLDSAHPAPPSDPERLMLADPATVIVPART